MEFTRDSGEGGAAQRWIDDNLPTCPFCRSPALWKTAEGVEEQALVRWFFQCQNCKAVVSVIPDTPTEAFSIPRNKVKVAIEVDLRVESVERKEDEDFVGEEFPLNEFQDWAEES